MKQLLVIILLTSTICFAQEKPDVAKQKTEISQQIQQLSIEGGNKVIEAKTKAYDTIADLIQLKEKEINSIAAEYNQKIATLQQKLNALIQEEQKPKDVNK